MSVWRGQSECSVSPGGEVTFSLLLSGGSNPGQGLCQLPLQLFFGQPCDWSDPLRKRRLRTRPPYSGHVIPCIPHLHSIGAAGDWPFVRTPFFALQLLALSS